MITLYQAEWCPYCHRVREVLTELGLPYLNVQVSRDRADREELRELSEQDVIPVLVDGDTGWVGSEEIIAYLRDTYPPAPDVARHQSMARFRDVLRLDVPPAEALKRLRAALAAQRLELIATVDGAAIDARRLSGGYTLAYALSRAIAAKIAKEDPTMPAALAVPIAVYPADGGSEIAVTRPGATSWVYGDAKVQDLTSMVAERVNKALATL